MKKLLTKHFQLVKNENMKESPDARKSISAEHSNQKTKSVKTTKDMQVVDRIIVDEVKDKDKDNKLLEQTRETNSKMTITNKNTERKGLCTNCSIY